MISLIHVVILQKFFFSQMMQNNCSNMSDQLKIVLCCKGVVIRLFQCLLRLNVDLCKVLSTGLRNTTDFTYYLEDVND